VVVTRSCAPALLAVALAGCAVTTTYAPREVPAGVVISARDDPGPIRAVTVVLRDGTTIPVARLAADGDRLVIETPDGVVGRIPRERVAQIEIRRSSGALTVVAVSAGSLASLLFLVLLLLP